MGESPVEKKVGEIKMKMQELILKHTIASVIVVNFIFAMTLGITAAKADGLNDLPNPFCFPVIPDVPGNLRSVCALSQAGCHNSNEGGGQDETILCHDKVFTSCVFALHNCALHCPDQGDQNTGQGIATNCDCAPAPGGVFSNCQDDLGIANLNWTNPNPHPFGAVLIGTVSPPVAFTITNLSEVPNTASVAATIIIGNQNQTFIPLPFRWAGGSGYPGDGGTCPNPIEETTLEMLGDPYDCTVMVEYLPQQASTLDEVTARVQYKSVRIAGNGWNNPRDLDKFVIVKATGGDTVPIRTAPKG